MSWHPSAKATSDAKNIRLLMLSWGSEFDIPTNPTNSNSWLATAQPHRLPSILDRIGKSVLSINGDHKNFNVNGQWRRVTNPIMVFDTPLSFSQRSRIVNLSRNGIPQENPRNNLEPMPILK
jgi:hypothetical protein